MIVEGGCGQGDNCGVWFAYFSCFCSRQDSSEDGKRPPHRCHDHDHVDTFRTIEAKEATAKASE